MPAKSAAQYKFMAGIAHGMKPKGNAIGPSEAVAKEFVDKTPAKKRSEFMKGFGKKSNKDKSSNSKQKKEKK